MKNEEASEPFLLIDKYLVGDMTDEEQEIFLGLVKKNRRYAELVRKNVLADIFLFEKLKNEDIPLRFDDSCLNTRVGIEADLVRIMKQPDPELNTVYVSTEPIEFGPNGQVILNRYIRKRERFKDRLRRRLIWISGSVAAVILLAIVFMFMIYHYLPSENEFKSIATVSRIVDAVWNEGATRYKEGEEIGPCQMALKSGLVRLTFSNGAEVLLEGPTEFVTSSDLSYFCPQGTLHAYVPPTATGFEIKTPLARVIDRGTEFSLRVDQHETLLNVIKGIVDVAWSPKLPSISIFDGKGCSIVRDRSPLQTDTSSLRHISPGEFDQRWNEQGKLLKQKRIKENLRFDQAKNLIARYDFTLENQSIYPNQATGPLAVRSDAIVFAALPGEGRYAAWKAIKLRSKNDHIVIDVPGKLDEMTFRMTFCLEELPVSGVVLIASDDCQDRPGAFILQIVRDGRLQLRVRLNNEGEFATYFSAPIFSSANCHTWFNIVVSADRTEKTIAFYSDGNLITRLPWNQSIPFELGRASIGNQPNQVTKTNRKFRGKIEEIALLNNSEP